MMNLMIFQAKLLGMYMWWNWYLYKYLLICSGEIDGDEGVNDIVDIDEVLINNSNSSNSNNINDNAEKKKKIVRHRIKVRTTSIRKPSSSNSNPSN